MRTYQVFCNDRGPTLYSALRTIRAKAADDAARAAKTLWPPIRQAWGLETYAAIEWPPVSPDSQAWLEKHVNAGVPA
jgi:hypothetical protein